MNIYTPAELRERAANAILEKCPALVEEIMNYLAKLADTGYCQGYVHVPREYIKYKDTIATYFTCKGFSVIVGESGMLINFE